MQLADLRHRVDDRTPLTRALQDVLGPDRVFTHPADLIASGIRAHGLRIHVHHLVDLLDRAYAAAERRG